MSAVILSRAEYLVILDILHADQILGLENVSLFPADRDEHLDLISWGIKMLEDRGLVRIEDGRHTIERRLLELAAVVARPRILFRTIRDRIDIGSQLYFHYQSGVQVVEQILPDEDHFSLGQLPDIAAAMDRIVGLLNLPVESCDFTSQQLIARDALNQAIDLNAIGDFEGAMDVFNLSGWASDCSNRFLFCLADQRTAGMVTLVPVRDGCLGEALGLTIVQDGETAWLLNSQLPDRHALSVRQINAASFRESLEESYKLVLERTLEEF